MNSFKKIAVIAQLILIVLAATGLVRAAGEVDASFLASVNLAGNGRVSKIVIQPDGKFLVGGLVPTPSTGIRCNLVRINPDGSVDRSFNPPEFLNVNPGFPNFPGTIAAIALQSDGKILVGGEFRLSTEARLSLVRLNPDGSVDQSFPSFFASNTGPFVREIIVLSNDRLLVGGGLEITQGGVTRRRLVRMDGSGNLDPTFDYAGDSAARVIILSTGKLLVGYQGEQNSGFIQRYNADGSLDGFFAGFGIGNTVNEMQHLPDGKILVGGNYSGGPNGPARSGLFRLNPDGTFDGTFPDLGINGLVAAIAIDASSKIYIGGSFTQVGGNARNKIARLNADGTIDPGFNYTAHTYTIIHELVWTPGDKVLVGGEAFGSETNFQNPLTRVDATGALDPTFNALAFRQNGFSFKVVVQPDNKILVGGRFAAANGSPRPLLARFNADGTLDTGFTPPNYPSASNQIHDIALQPDGKILVIGTISLQRLNPNGTLDTTFPSTSSGGWDVEVLPDGRVLRGGGSLIKIGPNGGFEGTLATVGDDSFSTIYRMAVQPDGKIIIVGNFTRVNSTIRNRLARINPNGGLDETFIMATGANANVNTVALQPDGKIIIGGDFTSYDNDSSKKYLARLNPNGSLDQTFSPVLNAPVLGLKIQTDGKILIGGAMSAVNGASRAGIARLNPNGSLDTSFSTGTGTNSTVWSIDQQTDGKIIYAGQFSRTNGFPTLGIGRLLNASVPQIKLFDYDGDGKADISVFRPSENKWYILKSSDGQVIQTIFAINGDMPTPADFDGDGKTDISIYRPSQGDWWSLSSQNGQQMFADWGQPGVIARPSDFDGDGKADYIYFLPSNSTWYRFGSQVGASFVQFGIAGDKPVTGDFDGDGKSDVAIYRPSTGDWWWKSSVDGAQRATHWGISTDVPAPADYDGDGKTDFAVYRPSNGTWYVYNSSNNSSTILNFGLSEDKPVPADYDGDGKADIAVFRPSTGVWYLMRSSQGFAAVQFGVSTDIPTPNAFVQ